MAYEGVDTVILYDELAYEDTLPLNWRAAPAPPADAQQQTGERNLRLLQACAALDEQGQTEKADDTAPHAADMLRLELKVNLLLDLVGRLMAVNQVRPAPVPLRFNARGATWKASGALPKPGEEGVVEIYLKDCLVDPLRMSGRVVNVSGGAIKVKFHNPGDAIADLIEKLAFRRHRRQVADQRQPKGVEAGLAGRAHR